MFLSERIKNLSPSATFAIDAKAKEMLKRGIEVINFGLGEPDFDTPYQIKLEAIKAIKEGFTKYTPAGGIDELKEAICRKLCKENNLIYKPSEIVVSPGAKYSLYAIFQVLINPGEEVIIPRPYWVSYPEQVKLAGGVPVFVEPGKDFQLNLEAIRKSISRKTKIIVINTPNNPSGAVFSKKILQEIADLAIKSNFYIISDEIYEKFIYENAKHQSIASFAKDRTILVNGVSKTYAMTGWRIGYLAGPEEIARAVSDIQSQSTSNPTSISQKAAVAALKKNRAHIEMIKEFDKRRKYIIKRLQEIKGVKFSKPLGAFYIFPDISAFGNSPEIADLLLEKARVAVIPGSAFGWDECIRLSYAQSLEKIKKGLNRMRAVLSL